ncbi:MAG: response regulator transcription factor [Candidatus Obscuribacterales bacterium]|nr:response regulator transcription factor [Candidatus Obscuribacterales bacterium]
MPKVLIVEDDVHVGSVLTDVLENEKYIVDLAPTLSDARHFLKISNYDMLILDWELPDGAGVDLCRELRRNESPIPILMLTGRSSINDKATGLDIGADDYLTKPFELPELLARIRSLFRRLWNDKGERLKFGPLEMIIQTRQVLRNGEELKLLRKEFDLLELMMRNLSTHFSTEMLLQRLWDSDTEAGSDAVFQCIRRLRRKIDEGEGPSIVHLEHGQGYCLQLPDPNKK